MRLVLRTDHGSEILDLLACYRRAREAAAAVKGAVPTSWAPHEQAGVAAGCPMPYTPHGYMHAHDHHVEQHAWSRRTHRLAQFLPNMAATEGALSIDNFATQRRKMMANDGGGAARPGRAVLSELGVLPEDPQERGLGDGVRP
eukprot:COSAG05_NODE_11203_length_525_cov_0.917840_1_plen_142_part_01